MGFSIENLGSISGFELGQMEPIRITKTDGLHLSKVGGNQGTNPYGVSLILVPSIHQLALTAFLVGRAVPDFPYFSLEDFHDPSTSLSPRTNPHRRSSLHHA